MKSLTIVGVLCFIFIIISDFAQSHNVLISPTKSVQCDNKTRAKQPLIREHKKLKSKQIPNWQRVIPGMFR